MPNKKIMKKWATVLEYGGYTQGKGKLRDTKTDERCCLGVLCDIAVADGVIPAPVAIGSNYRYGDEPIGDGSTTGLPPAVRKWAGMEVGYGNPRVDWNGQSTTLIDLNDNGKATFKDIAGVIREQLVND